MDDTRKGQIFYFSILLVCAFVYLRWGMSLLMWLTKYFLFWAVGVLIVVALIKGVSDVKNNKNPMDLFVEFDQQNKYE